MTKSHNFYPAKAKALLYHGTQNVVQRMLDYDYLCLRKQASVVGLIHPNMREEKINCKFKTETLSLPVHKHIDIGFKKHKNANVFINFAHEDEGYSSTLLALENPQISHIVLTGTQLTQRQIRHIRALAIDRKVQIIGPGSSGAITAGTFKSGNIGGTVHNIMRSRLHQSGSAGVITKSNGIFNEVIYELSQETDGLYEGIILGRSTLSFSSYLDHARRMEANPKIKFMVVQGESGGTEEYALIDAITSGQIKKPVIAKSIGLISSAWPDRHFDAFGIRSRQKKETAEEKNKAFKKAGALVPNTPMDYARLMKQVYDNVK